MRPVLVHVQDSNRNGMKVIGGIAILGIAVLALTAYLNDPNAEVAAGVTGDSSGGVMRRPASLQPASSRQTADVQIDYDKLKPTDFIPPLSAYAENMETATALVLTTCKTHALAKAEPDAEESKRKILAIDPSGEELKYLNFVEKVRDLQCSGYSESDFAKINDHFKRAASQGDVRAQFELLDQRANEELLNFIGTDAEDKERPQKLKSIEEILAKAHELVEKGSKDAAAIAAQITSSGVFGMENLVASATWRIIADQDKAEPFMVRDDTFGEQGAYAALTPQQRAEASSAARLKYLKCCADEKSRESKIGSHPFAVK